MWMMFLFPRGRCLRDGGPRAAKPRGAFLLHFCNSVSYLFTGGDCSFSLSAVMSVSIVSNSALNFGLLFCIRLLLASAMLSASIIISISIVLSLYILGFPMCLIAPQLCITVLLRCIVFFCLVSYS